MLRARRCGGGRKLMDGRHIRRQASKTKGNRIKRIERKRPDPLLERDSSSRQNLRNFANYLGKHGMGFPR